MNSKKYIWEYTVQPTIKNKETTIAKLRNALSPAYSLAGMVLMINSNPEMQSLCIKQAKKTIRNQQKISKLLKKIESEQAYLEKTSFTKIQTEKCDHNWKEMFGEFTCSKCHKKFGK